MTILMKWCLHFQPSKCCEQAESQTSWVPSGLLGVGPRWAQAVGIEPRTACLQAPAKLTSKGWPAPGLGVSISWRMSVIEMRLAAQGADAQSDHCRGTRVQRIEDGCYATLEGGHGQAAWVGI